MPMKLSTAFIFLFFLVCTANAVTIEVINSQLYGVVNGSYRENPSSATVNTQTSYSGSGVVGGEYIGLSLVLESEPWQDPFRGTSRANYQSDSGEYYFSAISTGDSHNPPQDFILFSAQIDYALTFELFGGDARLKSVAEVYSYGSSLYSGLAPSSDSLQLWTHQFAVIAQREHVLFIVLERGFDG